MSNLYNNINTIVIDDSIINNKIMYNLLKHHEQINNILIAVDGLDAINKICNNMDKIDIVFIDNQMPNLNGSIVIKLLRGINFNKIIMGITDCLNDDLLEFNNSGIDYVFKKPFDKFTRWIDREILTIKSDEEQQQVQINNVSCLGRVTSSKLNEDRFIH